MRGFLDKLWQKSTLASKQSKTGCLSLFWYNYPMTIDIQHFKEVLLKEEKVLEADLSSIGRKNPENSSDWEGTIPENGTDEADDLEVASSLEQFENNTAEVENLEKQLNDVKSALEKIENGSYGKCEVCGNDIEEDRLVASPSAPTCKLHMN
jgi:RNA polymerase-binding transcription factor DksA